MATKRERSKKRKRVSARTYAEKESSSGGSSNFWSMPDGFERFDVKAGTYRLDILPFRVGKNNPHADEGNEHFERTFWVHKDIGPNKEWHLCSAKSLNKPCPVCEYRAKLARDHETDEEQLKALSPKERQLWCIVDLDNPDQKLIWEFSKHLFGKQLALKINAADEEDEYDYFADPEEGKTVRVVFAQSKLGKWLDVTDLEFRDRKKQYDADIVDELPCLDDLLIATPYDKLEAAFLQIEVPEDDDAADLEPEVDDDDDEEVVVKKETKKRKPKPKPKAPTADDFDLEVGNTVALKSDEGGDCEIIKISKDGTSLTLMDEDEGLIKAVSPADVVLLGQDMDDEEVVEKEKPKAKLKAKAKAKVVDDEDEDNWDDDWDDEDLD